MIFMSMGKDYASNLIPVALQIRKVRDYQIHTQQFIIRERKPAVYNNNIIGTFIKVNILSDFPQTSQGDNPNRGFSLLPRRAGCTPCRRTLALFYSCPLGSWDGVLRRTLGLLLDGRILL